MTVLSTRKPRRGNCRRCRKCKLFGPYLLTLAITGASYGQLTGELGAHDPSTLIKEGSTYYYFATGQNVISRTSANKTSWSAGSSVFASPPAWTTQAVPSFTGFNWAPDIAYFNGKYHLYYSVSSWGTIDSAIGVATSPTLSNPTWTDQGKVVQSDAVWEAGPNTDTTGYNAIDPSILVDTDGKVYMAFGSYSSGILVTEINPSTGKRMNTASLTATQVANNASGGGWGSSIEGSALVKKGSYYYLFVNYGGCCSGVDSTYNIRVGRATSPLGPFLDKNGVDMKNAGGSMFLDDDGKMIGPGHFGLFSEAGQDYFGYHYYNGDNNGAATYGLRNLYWTSDNWPSYATVNPDWAGASSANWTTVANWSAGGVPNGVGHVANFGSNTSGRYSINIDAGGKTVSVINFRSASTYQIGANNGSTITLDAATGDIYTTINVSDGSHRIHAPIVANDPLGVNVTPLNSTLTLTGTITGTTLTKYGDGTLALSGVNNYSGGVLLRYGSLDLSSGATITTGNYTSIGAINGEDATMTLRGTASYTSSSDFNVGDTGSSTLAANGRLILQDTATLSVGTSGGFFVGSGFNNNRLATGTVDQSGGTLNVTNSGDGYFIIGGRTSTQATGVYNLAGGTVNANTNVRVGGQGTGTINQTGGTFNANGWISIGRFGSSNGAYNISAGTLNQTGTSTAIVVGESGTGVLTLSGSGSVVAAGGVRIGLSGGPGTIHLNGGTFTTTQFTKGTGSAAINFDGGILKPSGNKTTFLPNTIPTTIEDGGAIIDTNGFNIAIATPLLHDSSLGSNPDGGLVKNGNGTLTLSGTNNYTGQTRINASQVIYSQGLKSGGTVTLASGTLLEISASGAASGVSKIKSLDLSSSGGNYTSRLELHDNDLIIDYTGAASSYGSTVSQVKKGLTLLGGNGQGITSDRVDAQTLPGTVLAVVDNGEIDGEITNLSGYPAPVDSVLVKYTWFGDSNLDGLVNGADYALVDTGFTSGGSLGGWVFGDFNYDGSVTGEDYALIDTGFIAQTGTLPEPAATGVICMFGISILRRSRQK